MTALLKDLRHAIRVLLRTKSWTAVVLVSLALGIGANTALFTAVNGVMLATVQVPEPDRLIRFGWLGQNDMVRSSSDYGYGGAIGTRNARSTMSFPIFREMRAVNQTLTDLAAAAPMGGLNVIVNGDAEFATGYEASGAYFKVLGVTAALGRVFGEADDQLAATPTAVISDLYWRKRFNRDAGVIGRVVSMNHVPVTIIGVTAPDYLGIQRLGSDPPDVTVPLAFDAVFAPPNNIRLPGTSAMTLLPRMSQATYYWLQVVGRLKPGVTIEQVHGNFSNVFQNAARAGMAEFQSSLSTADRGMSFNRQRGDAVPDLLVRSAAHGFYDTDPQARKSASFLSVVVLIVLLIVCANVANLLLSRATSREREISVRLSMGATRGRLVRQLLTESLLLSCLGGLLGVLVGYGLRGLLPFGANAPLDLRVFGFVTGVSVLTGVLFGLVPALRATRVDLAGAMKEGGRSATGTRSLFSKGLLVLQVAMSLVLLVGAGLFLRTLHNLRTVDVGFDASNLLMFNVNTAVNKYDAERALQFWGQSRDRLAALPGVRSVALTRTLLLSGSTSTSSMWRQGQTGDKPAEDNMYMMTVSSGFFDTMGIKLSMGRFFDDHDVKSAPKVVIINEAAARKLFPDGGAIGRRLGHSLERPDEFEIVGVVGDTKYSSLRDPGPPTMYQAMSQVQPLSMSYVVRTAGDPMAMSNAVRAAMRDIDSALPLQRFMSQTDSIEQRFSQERLFALAYSLFGGLALVLACIGLFGVMSYSVSRRTNEIGIRMALGAQRRRVVGMVLGESMLLVGLGVAIGFASALAAGRLVKSVLFGLNPSDVTSIAGAIVLIAVVSALAAYLPARRASNVDPMAALRQQ